MCRGWTAGTLLQYMEWEVPALVSAQAGLLTGFFFLGGGGKSRSSLPSPSSPPPLLDASIPPACPSTTRKEVLNQARHGSNNILDLFGRHHVGRRDDDMVTRRAVDCAAARIQQHRIGWCQTQFIEFPGHIVRRRERRLGCFVLDKLDAPEQASSPDVTHVGMAAQKTVQQFAKQPSHDASVVDQSLLLDESLNSHDGCTPNRVPLVRVTMNECSAMLCYCHGRGGMFRGCSTHPVPFTRASAMSLWTRTPATGW